MIRLLRTDAGNRDFQALVACLDEDLAIRDGLDHSFYAQFNTLHNIQCALVAYDDEKFIGCGATKPYAEEIAEVKRMYTLPAYRGMGIASLVLQELEKWVGELSFTKIILETGKNQPEAIALYLKSGYRRIDNYGQYAGIANSLCFEKQLKK